jgi:hypothetical protein
MRKLGSFCIFWLLGWQIGFVSYNGVVGRAGIGFVLHFLAVGLWPLAFGFWLLAEGRLGSQPCRECDLSFVFLLSGFLYRPLCCEVLYQKTGQKSKIKVQNCGIGNRE